MSDWKEAAIGSVGAIITALGGTLIFAQGVFEKLADKSLYLKADKETLLAQLKTEVSALQKQIDAISTKINSMTDAASTQEKHMSKIEGSIDALTHEDWEQEKKKIYSLHELQLKVNANDFRLRALESKQHE